MTYLGIVLSSVDHSLELLYSEGHKIMTIFDGRFTVINDHELQWYVTTYRLSNNNCRVLKE